MSSAEDDFTVRSRLTEKQVYTRPGAYAFSCTGPMVVSGRVSNFCPDPGFVALDDVTHRVPRITVFYAPGDVVSVAYDPPEPE